MIESLRGPEEAGLTSNATVSDIVKGLTKSPAQLHPRRSITKHDASAPVTQCGCQ